MIKKAFIFVYVFLFMAAIAVIIFLAVQNKALKSQLNQLIPGEKIEYFDITGFDSENVNAEMLNSQDLSLLFIFNQPCFPCDHNIALWNRIGNILKQEAVIYGIIPGEPSQMADLYDKAALNFKLYVPHDLLKFKETMRLRMNLAQTILFIKGRVAFVKIGDLEGGDYTYLVTEARKFLNENQKNSKLKMETAPFRQILINLTPAARSSQAKNLAQAVL